MKCLYRVMKKADKLRNRIIIPKFITDEYGYEFYLEVYEDGSIKLIPAKKEK